MTKKTMFEMVFPNANTGNGVTFTEENLNQDYANGWRYIVWIGGVDNYFKNFQDAKQDADEWKAKGYDDVIIERIEENQ
jgi:hypothetical protein